jgi:N-formylmaleamate deformylase
MTGSGFTQDADRQLAVRGYRRIEELIPAHWSEGTVRANGIRQHYYRTGGDKLALVLLHGFTESGLCWMHVAKALERDYNVIMVDARGHGQSESCASGYSPDQLAEDVAAFIHALGLEMPRLLGHSMGASAAARIAAAHRDLVSAVALEDPPWKRISAASPADSEGYRAWQRTHLVWLEALKRQTHEERLIAALPYVPMGADIWPEDEYVPFVEACAQVDLDLIRRGPALWSMDGSVGEVVPQIACRVLLMQGMRPVPGAGPSPFAHEDAAGMPNVTTVPFETSHFIRREAFDRYITVARAFFSGDDVPDPIYTNTNEEHQA